MKTRELRRILKRYQCIEVRQSGSHLIVGCGECQTVVPIHSGDIAPGTLRAIVKHLTPCLGEGWLNR
jgi:predicted RNA binding protein YcfA (HicA-like mRNA interferase family)